MTWKLSRQPNSCTAWVLLGGDKKKKVQEIICVDAKNRNGKSLWLFVHAKPRADGLNTTTQDGYIKIINIWFWGKKKKKIKILWKLLFALWTLSMQPTIIGPQMTRVLSNDYLVFPDFRSLHRLTGVLHDRYWHSCGEYLRVECR